MKWIVTPGGIAPRLTKYFIACSILSAGGCAKPKKKQQHVVFFTDAAHWLQGVLFRKAWFAACGFWMENWWWCVCGGGGGGRQSSPRTFLIAFGLKRISRSTNFSTAPVCWSPSQTSSCLLGFICCSLRLRAPASQQGRPCLMCATQTLRRIFFLCDQVVKCNTNASHCPVGDGMLQEVLQCLYHRCHRCQGCWTQICNGDEM